MRTVSFTRAIVGLMFVGAIAGCSGTEDASPDTSTGGVANAGGNANAGGRASTGGGAQVGGRTGVGGAASTSAIAQVCASDCAILSQTDLSCVPDDCATSCENRYDNAAVSSSCQSAYLSLLQCGAQQPAANWSCYQLLIPAPTTGCDAELNTLASQDLTCFVALAVAH